MEQRDRIIINAEPGRGKLQPIRLSAGLANQPAIPVGRLSGRQKKTGVFDAILAAEIVVGEFGDRQYLLWSPCGPDVADLAIYCAGRSSNRVTALVLTCETKEQLYWLSHAVKRIKEIPKLATIPAAEKNK